MLAKPLESCHDNRDAPAYESGTSSLYLWRGRLRAGHAGAGMLLAVVMLHGVALAQSLPGSVDPGRLQQRLQPAPAPPPSPEIISPEIPEALPPAEAGQVRFRLRRIVVDGATVYTPAQLEALYADVLGRDVSLREIYRIADTITVKYRSDGYILSRAVVPAQRIAEGEVHIRVVEGFIDKVAFQGTQSVAVRTYGEQLTRSRPLTAAALERYLLLMNDLPGMRARGVLAPAAGVLGGSELTIIASEKPVDVVISLDNRGTKFIGPLQLVTEGAVNDASGRSDRLGLRYVTTPGSPDELRYIEATYGIALGEDGTKLALSLSRNESMPGRTLRTDELRTEARGEAFTGRLSHPFLRSRAENLSIDLSFTARNSIVDQYALPSETRLVSSYDDRVRAVRLGASYDTADYLDGLDFVRVEVSQGVSAFNASDSNRLSGASRPGGKTRFTKVTVDASRLQNLDGVARGLGLLTAISAGTSFGQQLLASEQFGVGGLPFGRGYDPSELTGDAGAALKLELQYDLVAGQDWPRFQLYTFYDYGIVADKNPEALDQPEGTRSLASIGLGVRAALSESFQGNLELAKPLTRPVAANADSSDPEAPRAYFTLIGRF